MKETSYKEAEALLNDASPELKEKYNHYTTTTEEGMHDLEQRYEEANASERRELLNNLEPEFREKFTNYLSTTKSIMEDMAKEFKNANFEEKNQLLEDMEPDVRSKFLRYYESTKDGMDKMAKEFFKANQEERDQILEDMGPELRTKFASYISSAEKWKSKYTKYYEKANEEIKSYFDDPELTKAAEESGEAQADAMINGLKTPGKWAAFRMWLADVLPGGKTGKEWGQSHGYASYAVGTNYVPNDGLAYIHKGEAIIPADQNVFAGQGEAFNAQLMSNTQLLNAIAMLNNQLNQGIKVNGEFRQRGSDLVAVVNKTNSQAGANIVSDTAYVR